MLHLRGGRSSISKTVYPDLAEFWAHTFGMKAALDLPPSLWSALTSMRLRNLHIDLAFERYFRSNDLRVSIYSCGLGLSF